MKDKVFIDTNLLIYSIDPRNKAKQKKARQLLKDIIVGDVGVISTQVIEEFFVQASPVAGIHPKALKTGDRVYRVGRVPRTLIPIGDQLEPKFGKLGREYANIIFDKEYLKKDPTLEWVTPGHPLFEVVREDVLLQVNNDLSRGSVFYDLHTKEPYRLDVYSASICDGMRKEIHKRLFVVQTDLAGGISVRQPTIFLDLAIGDNKASLPDDSKLLSKDQLEVALVEKSLKPFLQEICDEREKEVAIIMRHVTISLDELIHKQNMRLAELINQQQSGDKGSHLPGLISQAETHVDELNNRKERRLADLKMERNCMIDKIEHLGRAWVLPHPERTSPSVAFMVRDDEI